MYDDSRFTGDGTDNLIEVTLSTGQNLTDQNFIDERLRRIEGHVLEDEDNDDLGDSGIPNILISLIDPKDSNV